MKPAPSSASLSRIANHVRRTVESTPVFDIHTHLYDPAFKSLLLWGIDDLLVYHYLVAEAFRVHDLAEDKFWSLTKSRQAEIIWDALFIQNSPVSEACRGVLTALQALGLDVKKRDLPALRKWFASQTVEKHITRCMELAGVRKICMTNSPFDDEERRVWETGFKRDPRFAAALRVDPLVLSWPETSRQLAKWGYRVDPGRISEKSIDEARRFLADWTCRIRPLYVMVSLPPDFGFPGRDAASQVIERAVLPHCRETGQPFALMIGVKRAVNPRLKLAGDGVGRSNLDALSHLCAACPDVKFLVTALGRENQHELCVLARKFRNLHIFGCWWFTNIPSLIDEITRMRIELLGLSFTPQHSDARVLDQIIYKWRHSRAVIAKVLTEKYVELAATGWAPTDAEIERDVANLFGGAFEKFCG